ncbi:ABC transporter permease [Paenibacillus sp. MER TA 81-3]|uniref:ABC transporter permease n=1 Tax=Paenibacillus sp. MER TA 81-3 TaxID=2939573 RepID=UPI00204111B6|nr:ABC transporter permease [Paenibacillus sp. MER TA 81-3]MCM3337909.1 ABC transporter permease [Paenibacillus sp. MER TA 81-3]
MPSLWIAQWFLKRMLSQKRSLIVTFLLPAIIVSAFMLLLHIGEQGPQRIEVVSRDHSPLAQYLLNSLKDDFELKEAANTNELRENVFDQKASAGFILPERYGDMLLQGEHPVIEQIQLGMNEANIALKMRLEQHMRDVMRVVDTLKASGLQGNDLETRTADVLTEKSKGNVRAETTDFQLYVSPTLRMSMGMLLMFMLMSLMNAVSIMLEDKQNYTMMRTYAAPVRAYHIALGQFLGGIAFGTMQIAVVLLITRYLIGIDMSMTLLQQWVLLELFLIAGMGMACMLGSIIGNSEHFSRVNFFLVVPTCMISGCYWPVEFMNDSMQKISYFVPQRWVLDAMEQLAAGGSWSAIALHVIVLLLFGVVLLGIGSTVLRPATREAI